MHCVVWSACCDCPNPKASCPWRSSNICESYTELTWGKTSSPMIKSPYLGSIYLQIVFDNYSTLPRDISTVSVRLANLDWHTFLPDFHPDLPSRQGRSIIYIYIWTYISRKRFGCGVCGSTPVGSIKRVLSDLLKDD